MTGRSSWKVVGAQADHRRVGHNHGVDDERAGDQFDQTANLAGGLVNCPEWTRRTVIAVAILVLANFAILMVTLVAVPALIWFVR
jgi:hypothetical protein